MGLFDVFSTSDQNKAAQDEIAGLQAGYNQLSGLFDQGRNALNTDYAAALAPLNTVQGSNLAGLGQLQSLLGIGPSGSAGIQTTLENLPGYQFALDQGTQNVLRNQAATGQLDSGATDKAIADYTTGLANQNYTNYLAQLQPFLGAANAGASGIAGVNQGLGNQTNASYMTQGNAAYGTAAAQANAQAQSDLAGLTQSQNLLGLLGGAGAGFLGFKSDERAKDDIEPVGELFDGQTVYRYRYKGDPRHTLGLIAQEVEDAAPSAVIHDFGGSRMKGVDYRRATDWAAELGRMREAA